MIRDLDLQHFELLHRERRHTHLDREGSLLMKAKRQGLLTIDEGIMGDPRCVRITLTPEGQRLAEDAVARIGRVRITERPA